MSETKSCEYCRDWDEDEFSSDILTASIPLMPAITDVKINFELFINRNKKIELYVHDGADGYRVYESNTINYCPFCGRKIRK
jgi:hypothetical protein